MNHDRGFVSFSGKYIIKYFFEIQTISIKFLALMHNSDSASTIYFDLISKDFCNKISTICTIFVMILLDSGPWQPSEREDCGLSSVCDSVTEPERGRVSPTPGVVTGPDPSAAGSQST